MSALTVLFDLDGTLTDSRAGITACIRHALDRIGHPCPDDDVLAAYIGPPLRGTFSTLLGTTDPALIEVAVAHYRARYDDVGLFENRVYDGVPEMLEESARRARALFVATAKLRHAATRIVTHFDLARHFESVHGAEPGGRFDAKEDLLAHLLETGVVRAETSVMVGDRGQRHRGGQDQPHPVHRRPVGVRGAPRAGRRGRRSALRVSARARGLPGRLGS